uniref:Phospholipase-like protein n=1 Tax=Tanacetum cinerariifolium TaxID=118510 RepID=A0A6L2M9W9_TANCI|nr:phospholipase-like protein [Tanacetum cinerariifolium]
MKIIQILKRSYDVIPTIVLRCFGSIAAGLDNVNPVIRLLIERGISRVLGTTNEAPSSSIGQCKVVNADHEKPNRPISPSASVNVMPRNIFEYLRLANLRNTNILVEMADMTKKAPLGIIKNLLSRSFYDYKWVFNLEIDQLADEYELGIRKKGHMLDKIWEYCKDVHRDITYWWHDHGFKVEEHDEMGIEIKKYDPPYVQVEPSKLRNNH